MTGIQPGIGKDNAMTRLLDEVKRVNQERGALAGKFSGTPIISPNTRVSSAAMRAAPIPLSEVEKRERDFAARDLGILDQDELDAIDPGTVPTLFNDRMTAREFVASQNTQFTTPEKPRLIDFKKVQGIDLFRNIAYVDGFEITIPDEKIFEFKEYIMNLAVDYVTKQLAEAIAALNENIRIKEEMPSMPEGTAPAPILFETEELPSETKPVQKVRRKRKSRVDRKKPRKAARVEVPVQSLS